MKKSLLLSIALGLLMPLAHAEKKTETASKSKPTATSKKTAKKTETKKTETKKTETKPGELSESDKALVATATEEVKGLTAAQKTKLMDLLNKGDVKALTAVDGVGEEKAKNLIGKRPYAAAEDAILVDGIGEVTFKNLVSAAKGGKKEEAKEEKTEKKAEKPKAENSADKTEKAAEKAVDKASKAAEKAADKVVKPLKK